MILLLDHYDSFTHNLEHLLRVAGAAVTVARCDRITAEEALGGAFKGIVLSPGPGGPGDRGVALELLRRGRGAVPFLGVCLGHQAMALAAGGRIAVLDRVVHGKVSPVLHDGRGIYASVPSPFPAMRYHSLVADPETLPARFSVAAWLEDGTVMGIRDRETGDEGIQFHPESFLTGFGETMIRNFLTMGGLSCKDSASV